MRSRAALCLCGILLSAPLSAQVVITPTSTVSFAASPDQAVTVGGVAVVTDYTVRVLAVGSSTVVFSRSIGKPTPDATNAITVPIGWTAAQIAALPSGTYILVTTVTGPGGTADSMPSDPFVVLTSPRAPGKPAVVR